MFVVADSGDDGSDGEGDADVADCDEDDSDSDAGASPVDHCSHLQHIMRALTSLIRDPRFDALRPQIIATAPDIQTHLQAIFAAAEAEAERGVPLGVLGPVAP